MTKNYKTKDSGKRYTEDTGFQRDTQEGKPRYYLMFPKGIPYNEQPMKRLADLFMRGASKYTDRNWELADSPEALERAKESLLRHAIQAVNGENDEDHYASTMFNAIFCMVLEWKLKNESAKK